MTAGTAEASRCAWAPDLPEAWDVTRLRWVSRIFAGGTPDRKNVSYWTDGTVPWINSGSVNQGAIQSPSELISAEALAAGTTRWAPRRSVVVALAGQGKTKGMSARLEIDSTLNQSLAAVVPSRRMDYSFIHYWLMANYQNLRGLAGGDLRDGLNLQHVGSVQIPLPPLETQRAIADYLDRETAQIDAFIAKNEKLIALLNERRDAVILSMVTSDPGRSHATRSTGTTWFGEIPAGWTVQRLRTVVVRARNGLWGDDPSGGDDDVRVVRVADFDRAAWRTHNRDRTLRKLTRPERAGRTLAKGDLLLEKSGGTDRSPVGYVVQYDQEEPAVCSNFVARMELREGMHPRYWCYVQAAMYQFRITSRSLKQSTGIQNLDQASYFNELVPVPPEAVQTRIADRIDDACNQLDAAVSAATRAVALAKERRAALISAAVTGKIDVGVAA